MADPTGKMADLMRSPAKKKRRRGKGAGASDGVSEHPAMPASSWGLCWWCLRAEHDPSKCASREVLDMIDFARTRTLGRHGMPGKCLGTPGIACIGYGCGYAHICSSTVFLAKAPGVFESNFRISAFVLPPFLMCTMHVGVCMYRSMAARQECR